MSPMKVHFHMNVIKEMLFSITVTIHFDFFFFLIIQNHIICSKNGEKNLTFMRLPSDVPMIAMVSFPSTATAMDVNWKSSPPPNK